jgi:predicted nucleic acid-binding protein
MTLVDTSIWIEVFRRRHPLDLTALVDFDAIVTCLPVMQEVLQGFRDEQAHRLASDAMLAMPIVESPLGQDVIPRCRRAVPDGERTRAHRAVVSRLPHRRVCAPARSRRAP